MKNINKHISDKVRNQIRIGNQVLTQIEYKVWFQTRNKVGPQVKIQTGNQIISNIRYGKH